MPRQIVNFPPALFDVLYRHRGSLAIQLGLLEFNVTSHEADGRRSILVGGYSDPHGIGPRSVTRDCRLAIVLTAKGSSPTHQPKPLPDDVTLRLLDAIEPVLLILDGITGHESLALVGAFDEARAAPQIPGRRIAALPLNSARRRRLRRLGLELSNDVHDALGDLDSKRMAYESALMASDLEGVVASLSCHAELGSKLRLRPDGLEGDSCAGLLAASRRGSLADAMASAAAMGDATIFALERFDLYAECYRELTNVEALAQLNAYVCGEPFHRRDHAQFRAGSVRSAAESDLASSCPVPPEAIRGSLGRWLEDFAAGRWLGIHPLIHAAIAHAELLRIRPFECANGRTARVLFAIILSRAGGRAMPWEVTVERLYADYQSALGSAINGRYEPLVAFLIRAANLALQVGHRMVEVLGPERDRLAACLTAPDFPANAARFAAEDLLGGVLVEGLRPTVARKAVQPALIRVFEARLLDRIRTPVGVTYSVKAVRDLMAEPFRR